MVKLVRGGLWIGLIKPYEPIPKDAKICECKLYKKRDNRWFLDVVVERNIPGENQISERNSDRHGSKTLCYFCGAGDDDGKTKFFGKDLNRVRCTLLLVKTQTRYEESAGYDKDWQS